MPDDLRVRRLRGPEIAPYIPDLARLRITVFREWPYLYDGSEAYESTYLQRYASCDECALVLVFAGDRVVGASTAMPLDREMAEFRNPFAGSEFAVSDVFYLGESVLLPEYRGRGLGHIFFDEREAAARELGRFRYTAFCAVDRTADDPRRPAAYRPLDGFWQKRGYERQAGLSATLSWREIGQTAEATNRLTFWTHRLV